MFLKKTLIIASAISLLSFSVIASADLVTVNNTTKDSAVRILTGVAKGACSGTLPIPEYTKAGETRGVGWARVGFLCLNSPNKICEAELHMTKDCTDASIAVAKLDLSKQVISSVVNVANSGYKVTSSGATVYINKA